VINTRYILLLDLPHTPDGNQETLIISHKCLLQEMHSVGT